MSLRSKQHIFLLNTAKLIFWLNENGYETTAGELYRTQEQQDIYYKNRLSKVKFSKHQERLAIDLNIFKNGKLLTDKPQYLPIHMYWISLHNANTSGYLWGWDFGHFEMK